MILHSDLQGFDFNVRPKSTPRKEPYFTLCPDVHFETFTSFNCVPRNPRNNVMTKG